MSKQCACGERNECDHSCMPDVIDGFCSHCGSPIQPSLEIENYRLALSWISTQSTDPKSREQAEVALLAMPLPDEPSSPLSSKDSQ